MRAGTILWFASASWLAFAPLVVGRADTSSGSLAEADQDFQKALSIWGDGTSAEAESLLGKALALRQTALGPSHPKVAEVVGRLGAIEYNRANYAAAEIKFRQAYEIDLQTLGLHRLETAYAMGDLGAALREEHRYDEAARLVEGSIAVRRELLPPSHLSIAGGLDNLARIYLGERRLSDARRAAEESLQIYKAALPLNHPRVRGVQDLLQRIQNADAREHRLLVTLLQGALAAVVGLVVLIGANLWAERRHLADNNASRSAVAQTLSVAGTLGLFGGAAFVVAIGAGWFVADYMPSLADDRNAVRNLGKLTSIIGIWLAAIASQALTNVGRVALGMPTHKIVYFHWSAVRPRIPLANTSSPSGNQRLGLQGDENSPRWFAAMEYYALILNRTYKVFVTDRMLCGAKVRGLVSNSPGVSAMVDQAQWVQTTSARIYDRLDVTSRDFLAWNSANFQIPWSDIAGIEYRPGKKWGMGGVPHSGRLIVDLRSGRKRELILLGIQNGDVLKRELEQAASGPTVEQADSGVARAAGMTGGSVTG